MIRHLSRIIYVSLFLPVLLPLIQSEFFLYSTVVPRTLFFTSAVMVAVIATCIGYVHGVVVLRYNRIAFLAIGLICIGGIATLLSDASHASMWSSFSRMEGFFLWLHVLLYVLLLLIHFDQKLWYRWIGFSLVVSGIVAIMAIAQGAGKFALNDPDGRIELFFGNPIFLGSYLMFHIVFIGLWFVRARTQYMRLLLIILAFLELVALIQTETRSAFLGLLVGVVSFLCLQAIFRWHEKKSRFIFLFFCGASLAFIISLPVLHKALPNVTIPLVSRFDGVSLETITEQPRYFLFKAAGEAIVEAPLFGYGFDSYSRVFHQYLDPAYFKDSLAGPVEPWADRAHNMYLDLAVSIGVPGMLVFLCLLVGSIHLVVIGASSQYEKGLLVSAILAYGVHSLFNFSVVTDLVLFAMVVVYPGLRDTQFSIVLPPLVLKSHTQIAIVCVGLCVGAMACFVYLDRAYFSMRMNDVVVSNSITGTDRFFGLIELLKGRHIDAPSLIEKLPYEAWSGLSNSRDVDEKNRILNALESVEYQKIREVQTPKALFYLAGAYDRAGDAVRAEEVYTQLLARGRHPYFLNAVVRLHLEEKEYDTALSFAEESYFMEETYRESITLYAATLCLTGRTEACDAVLRKHFGSVYVASDVLLRAYLDAGLYDRVIYTLSESVAEYPDRRAHWEMLLEAYERTGDADAFNATQRALKRHFNK